MIRRTTIELDQALLERAQRALGSRTIRDTVEESLRRVADASENAEAVLASRQRRFLAQPAEHADLEVLSSEGMGR